MALCMATLAIAEACSSQPPSPTPGPPEPWIACRSLPDDRCASVLAELPEHLPEGAVAHSIAISERLCDGPCLGLGPGGWLGHVAVEFLDGREPTTLLLEADAEAIAWEVVPTFYVRLFPTSAPLIGGATEMDLGHCGLESGIDVDGSFWDPVGAVDVNHADAINGASARFTLTSSQTARLETSGGLHVDLGRHTGPTYLLACD